MTGILSATAALTSGGSSTLNDGLLGAWNLNEASGNAIDSSGNGLDLTLNGTIGQAAGIGGVGNSRSFSGSAGNFFSHADTADLQFPSTGWTVAIWCYIADNTLTQPLITKDGATSGHREYVGAYFGGSGQFRSYVFTATDNAVPAQGSSFGAVTNNTWHLFVSSFDPSNASHHLITISIDDGTVDSNDLGAANIQTSTEPFIVGADLFTGVEVYLSGRLQRGAKWNRPLIAGEIAELYNGGAGKDAPY